jgi:hypothetical protein
MSRPSTPSTRKVTLHRARWLVAAGVLFAAAAWLMWSGEGDGRAARRTPSRYEFPRRAKKDDVARMEQRRTLPARPADPDAGLAAQPRPRDPLLVALPPASRRAVVFEASAIRDSALGRLIIECALSSRDLERIEALRTDAGIDVMGGLDRIGVADDVAVVTGDFSGARLRDAMPTHGVRSYGAATLYEPGPETSRRRRRVFATWGAGMVISGRSSGEVEQAIDRLEGRASATPPIDDGDAYGEIYGVVSASELSKLLPEETRSRLQGAAERVELHVDTRNDADVLIVADANGQNPAQVDDLAKSLGAALAVARVKARHDGDDALAELLDLARVSPESGKFRLEVALPLETLRQRFGRCAERAEEREE